MSCLSASSSDSEPELDIYIASSPADQVVASPSSTSLPPKTTPLRISSPQFNLITPFPTELTSPQVIVATDLLAATFLRSITSAHAAVHNATITTGIPISAKSRLVISSGAALTPSALAAPSSSLTTVPFALDLFTLPNTSSIFVLPSLSVPSTVAGLLAQALITSLEQQSLTIAAVTFFSAVDIATVSQVDPRHFPLHETPLPLVFHVSNAASVGDAAALPNVTLSDKIRALPQSVPLHGFAAALLALTTALQIPAHGSVVVVNSNQLSATWLGFERFVSQLRPETCPSVYETHGTRNAATQKRVFSQLQQAYHKILSQQNRTLPRGLQDSFCRGDLHELYA